MLTYKKIYEKEDADEEREVNHNMMHFDLEKLNQFKEVLVEKEKQLEKEEKFGEAAKVREKVNDLNFLIRSKQNKEIQDSENAELQDLIDTRDNQLNTLKNDYINGTIENKHGAEQLINELTAKHEKQIEEFKTRFEEEWRNKNPGYTSAILDRIKARDTLSKKKQFKDAQKFQDEIDKLKEDHLKNWNGKIKQKIFSDELQNLKNRQNLELNCLKQKIKTYQDKFESKMNAEDKKLKNKYEMKEKNLITEQSRKKNNYFKYNHFK